MSRKPIIIAKDDPTVLQQLFAYQSGAVPRTLIRAAAYQLRTAQEHTILLDALLDLCYLDDENNLCFLIPQDEPLAHHIGRDLEYSLIERFNDPARK